MEIFTDVEKQILKGTDKSYKWIARDKNGRLYIYNTKPYKNEDCGFFNTKFNNGFLFNKCFSDVLFKNVTWENSPIQFRDDEPLTHKEKEYLKFVFKPFASNIMYVHKQRMRSDDTEYIAARTYKDSIIFPYFTKGTMYKGMKLEVKYMLKELRIIYKRKEISYE